MITRRELNLLAIAGAAAAASPALAGEAGRQINIGCNTYTFDGYTLDGAIRGVALAGFKTAELHCWHVEPRFAILRLPRQNLTAEQQALAKYQREELRRWRLNTPLENFADVAARFNEAGVKLTAFNYIFPDLDEAETERIFLMTKALGLDLITAVGSVATLRRLDVYAKKHQVRVGIHNEREIPTVAAFEAARQGLSDYTGYTLDIGHFIANGGNPIEMLEKNRARIFGMHIKDRRRNSGPTLPFGEGDTPIREVLRWMRDNNFNPPVNIEQEAQGWDRLAIAKQALEYSQAALRS